MSFRSRFVEPPVNIVVLNREGLMGLAWQTWLSSHVAKLIGAVTVNDITTNPPSLAAGQRTSVNVPMPGSTPGDFVKVGFTSAHPDVVMWGHVSAPDTVTVWFENKGLSPVDLAEGRLYVHAEKR